MSLISQSQACSDQVLDPFEILVTCCKIYMKFMQNLHFIVATGLVTQDPFLYRRRYPNVATEHGHGLHNVHARTLDGAYARTVESCTCAVES